VALCVKAPAVPVTVIMYEFAGVLVVVEIVKVLV